MDVLLNNVYSDIESLSKRLNILPEMLRELINEKYSEKFYSSQNQILIMIMLFHCLHID